MKKLVIAVLVILLTLCGCTVNTKSESAIPQAKPKHTAIYEIDHCVVEPDDRLHMTQSDKNYYKKLVNAMLKRNQSVSLSSEEEKNIYYLDLLRQSPYYFFVSECTVNGKTVSFSYAYSEEEQSQMLQFIDNKFLEIVNYCAEEDDNDLDKILKVYNYVAKSFTYDHSRTDNKQLDSPLFEYPADEIYKFLKSGTGLCYGFAYTVRFALLQHGIDCFCVYGECDSRKEAHMWNIFKFNGRFYNCDAAWDRSDNGHAKLYHFGKTDAERSNDALILRDFSQYHFPEYGDVLCDDNLFSVFRGGESFYYISTHKFFIKNYDGSEKIFDTQSLSFI